MSSLSDLRFDYVTALLAWRVSRKLNGPHHPLVRQLASRLEFAGARYSSARSASAAQP
jgi:hypothetical protein